MGTMTSTINEKFIIIVEKFRKRLSDLKIEFDSFDKNNSNIKERNSFVLNKKESIFKIFDEFFIECWEFIKHRDKKTYHIYQNYYQEMLGHPLLDAEINKYIAQKPLGYPGDYATMNYIYDYHDKLLGISSFDMLINCYTVSIPISKSNLKRKEYFKHKIIECLQTKKTPYIASVGCGPARELIELLEENKIDKPLNFSCVDFEEKALEFVREKIDGIDKSKREYLNINYFKIDVRDLLKNRQLQEKINQQDFIYISGLLDYLSSKLSKRIMVILFDILHDKGSLILVNAGLNNEAFRSYYELLGGWTFFHRSKEELLEWTKDLKNVKSFHFEKFSYPTQYLFLLINKK